MDIEFDTNKNYGYKLNSNWKQGKNAQVNGVTLSTEKWTEYTVSQDRVAELIRTKLNPTGTVDFRITQREQGIVYYDSLESFKSNVKFYKLNELATLSRPKLREICKAWALDSRHKTDEYLRKLIIEFQEKYSEYKDKKVIVNEDGTFKLVALDFVEEVPIVVDTNNQLELELEPK